MNKTELIHEVDEYLRQFTPVLTASGVNVLAYQQEYESRTVPQVKEGRDWLKMRAPVIDEYLKVRKLLKEEIWEQYKHMDTEDFREVIMLNAAIVKIKKTFVGRPALFRKVKDARKCKRSVSAEG
jgi:hypothetical protein